MTESTDIEGVLARFRHWWQEVRDETASQVGNTPSAPETEAIGLYDVVREFTALRHEVKLQTKSSRGLEEQTAAAVQALQEAAGRLRQMESEQSQAVERGAAPLVEAMADLDEALERGQTTMESAATRLQELWTVELARQMDSLASTQPFWRRWLCRGWRLAMEDLVHQTIDRQRQALASLTDGYRLVRGRLERTMAREGLQRIRCVDRPVDPHTMTVVEAVEAPDRPSGTVLGEIRPGYRWKDRVLRFAEVRASTVGPTPDSAATASLAETPSADPTLLK